MVHNIILKINEATDFECSLPTWNLHLRPWTDLGGFLFRRKAFQENDWLSHKIPLILHL